MYSPHSIVIPSKEGIQSFKVGSQIAATPRNCDVISATLSFWDDNKKLISKNHYELFMIGVENQ
jgi:hypothetical protein